MKVLLIGKRGSLTNWLEDAAAAFRGLGHVVKVGAIRHANINLALERLLYPFILRELEKTIRALQPDLILCVGGFHVPEAALQIIRSTKREAPLVGWVGDIFADTAAPVGDLYDLLAYTDSALVQRHKDMGLKPRALFLPHAVDPRTRTAVDARERRARMVFVATPTPQRERTVCGLAAPISLYGGKWRASPSVRHQIRRRRLPKSALPTIYGSHLAALNIRNESNVLAGLNQRSFEPALAGAALVADNQADLPLCFDPGQEVYAWNDIGELNDIHARILREPEAARAVGERGRKRVLADHTYARRLAALMAAI